MQTPHDPVAVAKRFCEGVNHIRRSWTVLRAVGSRRHWADGPNAPKEKIGDTLLQLCPNILWTLTNALTHSILLGVSRMTDPSEMRGGKWRQLSVERVIADLPPGTSAQVEIQKIYDRIRPEVDLVTRDRSKVLAHADLETSLLPESKDTPDEFSIRDVIDGLHEITRILCDFYKGDHWVHDMVVLNDDAVKLAGALKHIPDDNLLEELA